MAVKLVANGKILRIEKTLLYMMLTNICTGKHLLT